jgi:hypothetical protein
MPIASFIPAKNFQKTIPKTTPKNDTKKDRKKRHQSLGLGKKKSLGI